MADNPFDWGAAYGLESYVLPLVAGNLGGGRGGDQEVRNIITGVTQRPRTHPALLGETGPTSYASRRYSNVYGAGKWATQHGEKMAGFGSQYAKTLEAGPLKYASDEERRGVYETAMGEARSVMDNLLRQFRFSDLFGVQGFSEGQQDVLKAAMDIEAEKVRRQVEFRRGPNADEAALPGTDPALSAGGTVSRTILGGAAA